MAARPRHSGAGGLTGRTGAGDKPTYDWKDIKHGQAKKATTPKNQEGDLMFKMCKKISQLTKVIYNLHMKNDDLELQLENTSSHYTRKMKELQEELDKKDAKIAIHEERERETKSQVEDLQGSVAVQERARMILSEEFNQIKTSAEDKERQMNNEFQQQIQALTSESEESKKAFQEQFQKQQRELDKALLSWRDDVHHIKARHAKEIEKQKEEMEEASREKVRKMEVEQAEELLALKAVLTQQLEEAQVQVGKAEEEGQEARTAADIAQKEILALKREEVLIRERVARVRKELLEEEDRHKEHLAKFEDRLRAKQSETDRLASELSRLKKDLEGKSTEIQDLTSKLRDAQSQGDSTLKKMYQMEGELDDFKNRTAQLQTSLSLKATQIEDLEGSQDDLKKMKLLYEEKLKGLESKLKEAEEEKNKSIKEKRQIEEERDEEMKMIQETLEAAMEEKIRVQEKFDKEFENLRNVNADREQQMLDDFEWKLREVQQTCKKKLEEKEKRLEEVLSNSRGIVEKELEDQLNKISDERKTLQDKMKEVSHLKSFQAEVSQLQGLTNEQQKSLKVASTQIEEYKVMELNLREEIDRLKGQVLQEQSNLTSVHASHKKALEDAEIRHKVLVQEKVAEVNAHWEEKLRMELERLRCELQEIFYTDQNKAMEKLERRLQTEAELAGNRIQELGLELRDQARRADESMRRAEDSHNKEMEKMRTNADRDIWELRRSMDKLDNMYQEQLSKLHEDHNQDVEKLNEEHVQKLLQVEQTAQLQVGAQRTTLELVKEQMEKVAEERLRQCREDNFKELELLRLEMEDRKDAVVSEMREYYDAQLRSLQDQVEETSNNCNKKEMNLVKRLHETERALHKKEENVAQLQNHVAVCEATVDNLNHEVAKSAEDVQRIEREATSKIRGCDLHWKDRIQSLQSNFQKEMEKKEEEMRTLLAQSQKARDGDVYYLNRLLKEAQDRFEKRESRPEDLKRILSLVVSLEEMNENLLQAQAECKTYRLELFNREVMYSQFFGASNATVGLVNPLAQQTHPANKKEPLLKDLTQTFIMPNLIKRPPNSPMKKL